MSKSEKIVSSKMPRRVVNGKVVEVAKEKEIEEGPYKGGTVAYFESNGMESVAEEMKEMMTPLPPGEYNGFRVGDKVRYTKETLNSPVAYIQSNEEALAQANGDKILHILPPLIMYEDVKTYPVILEVFGDAFTYQIEHVEKSAEKKSERWYE